MAREHERRGLGREYLAEQRRVADDPRPDPDRDRDEADEKIECPFGRSWCSPTAALDDDDAMPCLSCYLRQDRDDGGPHPVVADVADKQETGD